jgi:hypothetical protein
MSLKRKGKAIRFSSVVSALDDAARIEPYLLADAKPAVFNNYVESIKKDGRVIETLAALYEKNGIDSPTAAPPVALPVAAPSSTTAPMLTTASAPVPAASPIVAALNAAAPGTAAAAPSPSAAAPDAAAPVAGVPGAGAPNAATAAPSSATATAGAGTGAGTTAGAPIPATATAPSVGHSAAPIVPISGRALHRDVRQFQTEQGGSKDVFKTSAANGVEVSWRKTPQHRNSSGGGYKGAASLGKRQQRSYTRAVEGYCTDVCGSMEKALVAVGKRCKAAFIAAASELKYCGRVLRATGAETAAMQTFCGISSRACCRLNSWYQGNGFGKNNIAVDADTRDFAKDLGSHYEYFNVELTSSKKNGFKPVVCAAQCCTRVSDIVEASFERHKFVPISGKLEKKGVQKIGVDRSGGDTRCCAINCNNTNPNSCKECDNLAQFWDAPDNFANVSKVCLCFLEAFVKRGVHVATRARWT